MHANMYMYTIHRLPKSKWKAGNYDGWLKQEEINAKYWKKAKENKILLLPVAKGYFTNATLTKPQNQNV